MMYDPQDEEKRAVEIVMLQYAKQGKHEIFKTPVKLAIYFYCRPLKSKKIINLWHSHWHTSKPDIDNMVKFYLDCANGIVFDDDRQVVSIVANKYYSEKPRTEMIVTELPLNEIDEQDKNILYNFSPKELKELSRDSLELSEYFENIERVAEEGLDKYDASVASSVLINFSKKWSKLLSKVSKIGKL